MRKTINVLRPNVSNRLRERVLHSKFTLATVDLAPNNPDVLDTDYRKVYVSDWTPNVSTSEYLQRQILEALPEFADRVDCPNVWQAFMYTAGCHFRTHSDVYDEVDGQLVVTYKRALTAVVSLSPRSDYDGGEFQFMHRNVPETYPIEMGDALLFTSDTMDNTHAVTPVKSGCRIVLTNWFMYAQR